MTDDANAHVYSRLQTHDTLTHTAHWKDQHNLRTGQV